MSEDGLKSLESAGEKGKAYLNFARAFNSFVNENKPFVMAESAGYGKDMKTITDANVNKQFGMALTAGQKASTKKIAVAMQKMIDVIEEIKDGLPANDLP